MKTMTLKYYTDPGHGWVKIKRDQLNTLGISGDISHYSYMKGDNVYLEEDCDLGRLFAACDKDGITVKLNEYHTDKSSKIRSYDSYRVPERLTNEAQHIVNFMKQHFQYIKIGA